MTGANGEILTIDIGGTKIGWALTDVILHSAACPFTPTLALAVGRRTSFPWISFARCGQPFLSPRNRYRQRGRG